MKTFINKIKAIIKGGWDTLMTNKVDLLSLSFWIGLILLTGKIAAAFSGGWLISNLLYTIGIVAAAVHFPWFLVTLIAIKTFGSFVNNSWEEVWQGLKFYGTDDDKACSKGELIQLLIVVAVYLVFVITFAATGFMVFTGVPVGG